jgi:ribosomal protein L18
MNTKLEQRQKIRYRIRKKISGTATKPRLSVFRSNADIYAQLIDDENAVTLASPRPILFSLCVEPAAGFKVCNFILK